MKTVKWIFVIFILLISCSDGGGQETPTDIQLSDFITDCNSERELFGNVENLPATILSFDIDTGPYYFRVVRGFDSTDMIFMCDMEEQFRERGRKVSITGVLQFFSEREKEILGLFPAGTRLFVLEPTNIEFSD